MVSIEIPPLRERREDIPRLVDHFLRRFAAESQTPEKTVSREAMDLLVKYHYPGNVRELENIIHRAVVLAREQTITARICPFGSPSTAAGEARRSPRCSWTEWPSSSVR